MSLQVLGDSTQCVRLEGGTRTTVGQGTDGHESGLEEAPGGVSKTAEEKPSVSEVTQKGLPESSFRFLFLLLAAEGLGEEGI